jgi:hypothetical protein
VNKNKTWWYKPRSSNQPRDLPVELLNLDGVGFEYLVSTMFSRIPGWKSQWNGGSHDHGADVVVTSSTGIRYAIQCKKYSTTLDNTPIQEVIGSLAIYGAQVGIVLTTGPGYTAGAKTLAMANKVILWDMNDLEVIAMAEATQNEVVLQGIGLQITSGTSSSVLVKNQPHQWVKTVAVLGTIFLAIFLLPRFMRAEFPRTTSQNTPDVSSFLKEYDSEYQIVLKNNDIEKIQDILIGPQAEDVQNIIQKRKAENCFRDTKTVEPMTINRVWQISDTVAIADVRKHWQQTEFCSGTSKLVVWKPFIATYTMVLDSGKWKVAKTTVVE